MGISEVFQHRHGFVIVNDLNQTSELQLPTILFRAKSFAPSQSTTNVSDIMKIIFFSFAIIIK